jgi:hypothetical protein
MGLRGRTGPRFPLSGKLRRLPRGERNPLCRLSTRTRCGAELSYRWRARARARRVRRPFASCGAGAQSRAPRPRAGLRRAARRGRAQTAAARTCPHRRPDHAPAACAPRLRSRPLAGKRTRALLRRSVAFAAAGRGRGSTGTLARRAAAGSRTFRVRKCIAREGSSGSARGRRRHDRRDAPRLHRRAGTRRRSGRGSARDRSCRTPEPSWGAA